MLPFSAIFYIGRTHGSAPTGAYCLAIGLFSPSRSRYLKDHNSLEAVIFDLGGVVFGISFDLAANSWAESSGVPARELAERFQADSHYERFETAEISPEEYRAHVCNTLGVQLSVEDFDRGWNSIYLDILPGIESLLAELRERLRLVVLTNTNQIHAPIWRARYRDILTYFEKVFASHDIEARKPEPEAFQIVLDYLNTDPREVAFFDDNPDNAQGANSVGIKGFVATSRLDVVAGLRSSGLEI